SQAGSRKGGDMTHWFWLLLTIACMVWYSTITVYVGIKGVADIKSMLARLSGNRHGEEEER
ncbi:MAG: hypothetical protein J2P31_02335, partial [Blastocatellia bacterium]|nr:hypothetical protein [Blastocatellia bacterium]